MTNGGEPGPTPEPEPAGPESAGSPEPAGPESSGAGASEAEADQAPRARARQRKQVLLRLDPAMHDALARWASDELRSTNAQIDYLLRRALQEAGRLPKGARPHPRRGRPPRED